MRWLSRAVGTGSPVWRISSGEGLATAGSAFGGRVFFASPAQPKDALEEGRFTLAGAPIVFVHSKVSVFDDRAGLVTSANLNGRSMRWDTEVGIEIDDKDQVRLLRDRVMQAWLPADIGDEYRDSRLETVALWRSLAEDNASLPHTKRRGFLLPHVIAEAEDFGTKLPGIPVEMV